MSSEISGGYNHYDPIRDLIYEESRRVREIEPSVSDRCAEVYKEALTFITRLDGTSEHMAAYDVTITSSPIMYHATKNDNVYDGYVWLQQKFHRPSNTVLSFAPEKSTFYLFTGARNDSKLANKLFALSPSEIRYHHDIYYKVGGHGELNFLWGVLSKIREAAFPKDFIEEAERKREQEAIRVRIAAKVAAQLIDD